MSAGPGRREVAHRLFAAEYDDATLEYAESDEERAPNFVVLPSGARVNRIFVVGVLTAVEQVNEDTVRARIADPTGAFVVYAGQYQPDELAALQSMESPTFVAVTGKANTFSPEGSDRVLTSVRPESVTEVDAETRDRWVVATVKHTLARVQTAADALGRDERGDDLQIALVRDGVEPGLAEGIAKAIDHYDTSTDYLGALADLATQALEVVAGERSEVEVLDVEPAGGDGSTTPGDLAALLDDDRLSVTRAAGDVDVEALVDDGADAAADAGEEATAESDGVSSTETSAADDEEDEESPAGDVDADDDAVADELAETTADVSGSVEADGTTESDPEPPEDANQGAASEGTPDEETEEEDDDAASEATSAETTADAPAETGDSAPDETYDVPEEEREEIEEEYGVGFQSGTEVDPAGEAGIETDDAPPTEDDPAESAESTSTSAAESDDNDDDGGDDDGSESDDGTEDDGDLEGPVLAEMEALDDGDGADREALIEAVAAETGADVDAIDDAIDDLLMSGQCYEPGDGQLKPI